MFEIDLAVDVFKGIFEILCLINLHDFKMCFVSLWGY